VGGQGRSPACFVPVMSLAVQITARTALREWLSTAPGAGEFAGLIMPRVRHAA